jgi:hypothetical protein
VSVRWNVVATVTVAALAGFLAGGTVTQTTIVDAYENRSVTEQVPQCTDEIADAGGICQGVPTWVEETPLRDAEIVTEYSVTEQSPDGSETPSGPVQAALLPDWGYDAYQLAPCAQEDGSGQDACYWNFDGTTGNGYGLTYVIVDGTTYYLSDVATWCATSEFC